ncbi:MAG TPA: DUF6529 family protein [Pseudonocardia sp.]|jgi:hypothetical protein
MTPLLVGCVVALTLGIYGHLHEPTGFSINLAGFSSGQYVKSWLVTAAGLLAIIQLATARLMYSGNAAGWVPSLHRWSGRAAVILTVPVVVHCLFALGFQTDTPRVLAHSVLGCVFYGAFVAKMLSLTKPGVPGWALPVLGGITFAGLIGLWLTSALWVFSTKGFHF